MVTLPGGTQFFLASDIESPRQTDKINVWKDLHELEHARLAGIIADSSMTITFRVPLFGEINKDWFGAHQEMHNALDQAFGLGGGQDFSGDGNPWSTTPGFLDWMSQLEDRHSLYADLATQL